MNGTQIESLSFEDSFERLDQVIHKLESGELSLDESVTLYEEGVRLAEHCGRHLDNAEQRVTLILEAVADQLEDGAAGA